MSGHLGLPDTLYAKGRKKTVHQASVPAPKGFLIYGGIIVTLLGVVGFRVGETPDRPFLGLLIFTGFEDWAHIILGAVGMAADFVLGADVQKWLVIALGLFGLFATVVGFLGAGNAYANAEVTNLELVENVLHLVVGLWALYVGFRPAEPAMKRM